MSVTLEAQPLSLSNAIDGLLEQRFQEVLGELRDIIAVAESDPTAFQAAKGILKSRITVTLDVDHAIGDGMTAMTGRVELKRPKQRSARRGVLLRGTKWLVEAPDSPQESLPLPGPRAIEAAK